MTEETKPAIHQTPIQIFLRFLRFGFLAFGGPVAQIAMLKQELVEEEKWVSREEFNRALAVYQALPGPEAHELCVWFGMIAGGRWGGFLAGLGFMLPGFALILALSWIYFTYGVHYPVLQSLFFGFQVAVIALIFNAVKRIGQHAIISIELFIAAIIAAACVFFGVSFLMVLIAIGVAYVLYINNQKVLALIASALLLGYGLFLFNQHQANVQSSTTIYQAEHVAASPEDVFLTGLKAGLLTFGGAYTAIPYVEQDAVSKHHWLSEQQFLDGIALSGVLPAPLIIFSTFVGFAASGWLGAFLITIGIFFPAFAFTLLGHGFFQRLIENKSIHGFLDGVTAAVIGIIAVTAIKLFIGVVVNWVSLVLFLVALFILVKVKSKISPIIALLLSGLLMVLYGIII